MQLENKVAVVTGAGSGIGRACALAFAARGADVVVAEISAERASAVALEVEALGRRGIAVPTDVGSDESVAALRAAAIEEFGHVDLVMSNVGVLAVGLPQEIPMDAWQRVLNINLFGTVRTVNAFLPEFVARGHGHIVATASTAGLFPYAFDRLPYASSKAAVIAYMESLTLYTRPLGIGTTLLCPAGVATNIMEQVTNYGEPRAPRPPALSFNTPDVVGEAVADAVERDRFQVFTAPEVHGFLARKAENLDQFLADQVDWITS
ncbi:MAG: SDR family NAD(P)-dependent oxidoreductase [Acidimicrobiia bacterium]